MVRNDDTPYHIVAPDKVWVGDSFPLLTDVPTGTQLDWIFGDSTSSTDFAPIHAYKNYGEYFVVAIVNGDSLNHFHKNVSSVIYAKFRNNPADYSNISSNRYWTVIKDSIRSVNGVAYSDTLANFQDTFALLKLDDETIVIKGDTLKNSFAGLPDEYVFSQPGTGYFWRTLNYYYKNDSIVYTSHPDQGGWSTPYPGSHGTPFGVTTQYLSHK